MTETRSPAYLGAYRTGLLERRAREAVARLASCCLCPRRCGVNRLEDQRGFCRTGRRAVVASYGPHFGEEEPLVGSGGSGTIFFSHCNLLCCFCQNYEISHGGEGEEVGPADLARLMVHLQRQGCSNVNLVSPSHVVAQFMEALPMAVEAGLRIPIVYNTGGYDLPETLGLLEGVVEIYMPDYKFTHPDPAERFSAAADYPGIVCIALREMYRQVGDLELDESGVARRGLLVRHLVLPQDLAGTEEAMSWIARNLSRETYVNIMDQYRPCGTAREHAELSRGIDAAEYGKAVASARKAGLERLDRRRALRLLNL
ncbi:MAG: radical SAM protein [bacterium]